MYLLKKDIELRFYSTDRSRAELAARLLRLAGVNAEVREAGVEGGWRVIAGTNRLAAGRKELRIALVKAVMRAVERGGRGEGRPLAEEAGEGVYSEGRLAEVRGAAGGGRA